MKSLFVAMLILLVMVPMTGWAHDWESTRKTLEGLPGVEVVVEGLAQAVKKDGLNKDQIQTDTESMLRKAGINVLSEEESVKHPASPYLYIDISSTLPSKELYAFNIDIELNQRVFLWNGRSAGAPTWSVSLTGTVGRQHVQDIRGLVKDYIAKFIDAWLSVNPKE
jgi:hypothetical protein